MHTFTHASCVHSFIPTGAHQAPNTHISPGNTSVSKADEALALVELTLAAKVDSNANKLLLMLVVISGDRAVKKRKQRWETSTQES